MKRYFIYGAVFVLDGQIMAATSNIVTDGRFPTKEDLVQLVKQRTLTAQNVTIMSICELSEEDYSTFLS